MKQLLTFSLIALLFAACGQKQENDQAGAPEMMTVSMLLEAPEEYVDQEIVLEGAVTHVCKHGGARLHLTDLEPNLMIRVEATENLPAFARELEGSDIVVTGLLRETRIDGQYLDEWEAEILEGETDDHDHHDHHDHADDPDPEGEHDDDGHVEPQGLEMITEMREELAASGKPYLSRYHVDALTYVMKDGGNIPVATPGDTEEGQ